MGTTSDVTINSDKLSVKSKRESERFIICFLISYYMFINYVRSSYFFFKRYELKVMIIIKYYQKAIIMRNSE
jgi:hypothetical protein